MSGKTLSTGTLSLRFMQNANRAKQLKDVELDRAEVVDAGKWEIGQSIRDTWGPASSSSSQSVQYESSYLPFLFPESKQEKSESTEAVSSNRPKGRRNFNKKGEEIEEIPAATSLEIPSDTPSSSPDRNSRKVHSRPDSISFTGKSSLRGLEEPKKHAKTAKQAIFENSNVGADIHSLSLAKSLAQMQPPLPNVFLKPAGVDDPLESKAQSSNAKAESNIIDGARRKKTKRPRDSSDSMYEESKRSRKKEF